MSQIENSKKYVSRFCTSRYPLIVIYVFCIYHIKQIRFSIGWNHANACGIYGRIIPHTHTMRTLASRAQTIHCGSCYMRSANASAVSQRTQTQRYLHFIYVSLHPQVVCYMEYVHSFD